MVRVDDDEAVAVVKKQSQTFLSYLERSGNIVQQKTHITSIVTIL